MSESTVPSGSPATPEGEGPAEAERSGPGQSQPPARATSATTNDVPAFGWSAYAERINGRFAMLGFLAVLLIEAVSQRSFLQWAGLS